MNTKPRILLLDKPHPKARAIMEEVADTSNKHKWIDYDGIFTTLEPIDKKVLSLAQNIKFIATPCTGTDHIVVPNGVKLIHLDNEWRKNEGREVTSTAEHTWRLVLELAKMRRMQLSYQTLGIIGYGRIGRQIAKYANAFKMMLRIYDKLESTSTLNETLKYSDIITLHIPLQNNEGFIGEKEFAMMKDGALLINTSRQGVIDIDALYKALESNKIGGYADDFANEVNFSEVFQDRVIQTPHIAGNSLEAREASDLYIAKKIKEYIEGGQ